MNTFRNLLGPDTVGAKELALLELAIPALHENAVKKGRCGCAAASSALMANMAT
jgi:hypothetical protein